MARLRQWVALGFNDSATESRPGISQDRQSQGEALKRMLDISGAFITPLLSGPLLVGVGLVLMFGSGRPILLRHKRIGSSGKIFYCYKIRTMVNISNEVLRKHLEANPAAMEEWVAARKLKQDPRVTKFGAFLRKFSIDEMPQFINVLISEMSLVGPAQ